MRKLEHRSLGGLLHHAAEGGPPNPPMQGRAITVSRAWLVLPQWVRCVRVAGGSLLVDHTTE